MAKRLKERIQVGEDTNGKPIYEWIDGYSRQELFVKAVFFPRCEWFVASFVANWRSKKPICHKG